MSMKLKSTKTSLYKLVSKYISIPIMKETEFIKTYRSHSYFLDWYKDGECYRAFLHACAGEALLSITYRGERLVFRLKIEDLLERGMIDELKASKVV